MTDKTNVNKVIAQKQFEEVLNTLSSFKSQITMLANQVRALQKTVNKEMKVLDREAKKNRMKGNKKPSGFAVPSNISAELCYFMNKPEGSQAARTEVTRFIIQYIRDNNLQNPQNKREIKPDQALKSLLGNNKLTKKEPITYFNIQRHMNKHFGNV
jgi:upstream activation factor subunit UAF30